MALHTLRKLEACHVGTDELGNGAVAEVAPVAVGVALGARLRFSNISSFLVLFSRLLPKGPPR